MTATAEKPRARQRSHGELESIFSGIDAPFAFVDLDAMWSNAQEMLARAAGTPIRVGTKSVRCRALLGAILERDRGFRGLLTFTLSESLWLYRHGFDDLLLAYPTSDRRALAELGELEGESPPILMFDSVEQLEYATRAAGPRARRIRACIDVDMGWWPLRGRFKFGVRRSPVRTPQQAQALAREIVRRPMFDLVGVMGYESHIAGVGDRPLGKRSRAPYIRFIKRHSIPEIVERRAAVVAAVREVAPVEIVNGGGTGSIHTTRTDGAITEITAGSGFYAPALFDRFDSFALTPAAMFAMPVVRRPGARIATLLGGGYPASGRAGLDRLPTPHLPPGLRLAAREGAGEVQTPVIGDAASGLRVGDNVYLRHAKAGELCERFQSLYLLSGGEIADEVATYRGEGRCEL